MRRSHSDLIALLGIACVALSAAALPWPDAAPPAGRAALTVSAGPATLQAWVRECEWSSAPEDDHSQAVHVALLNVELDLRASAYGTDRTVLGAGVALPTSMRSWHAMAAGATNLPHISDHCS